MTISSHIRVVPHYPRHGIMFRDITTLLKDGSAFHNAIDQIVNRYRDVPIDKVAGIESRGFIIGAPVAIQLQKDLFLSANKTNYLLKQSEGIINWNTVVIELKFMSMQFNLESVSC